MDDTFERTCPGLMIKNYRDMEFSLPHYKEKQLQMCEMKIAISGDYTVQFSSGSEGQWYGSPIAEKQGKIRQR